MKACCYAGTKQSDSILKRRVQKRTTGFSWANFAPTRVPLRYPSSRLDPTRPPPPCALCAPAAAALLAQVVLCNEGREAAEKTTGEFRSHGVLTPSLSSTLRGDFFAACSRTFYEYLPHPALFRAQRPQEGLLVRRAEEQRQPNLRVRQP